MHNPRLFLSRVGFFSKSGLLPWYATNPPDLSQSFWGRAHKGDFTSVTVKKHPSRQKYQKKQRHFRSLEDSWQERLADVVTPLWRLSYEEQLKVKFEAQKKIIQRLESSLRVLHGVSGRVAAPHSEGLRCHLHPIIPSPIIDGYRNKSTFSVNRSPDGNPKTVGYYLGTWRDGNIVCVPCSHLKNIPEKHSQVAQVDTGVSSQFEPIAKDTQWLSSLFIPRD
ncbi:tRNA (uracil(54)-C(5))-methyltransferase homolog isoform X3 [Peromyscus leucopus]|uniref:tRNA (uracil(54)-C(5))-methyltransferase homolog isoform X3 n=1 Tax=Peromyscus leucopus TaxID=10041 RepID=UPI0010A12298|nr:tRNA (uracil(54)-C(5))-methyltransferase homolog isoform X3 [Peromyscus leucopus]